MISRLEEHKMQQVEELRRRTEEGKDRIRQAKIAMERTWWDHLVEHVSSSTPAAGHMAVSTAPFFQDVPDRALSGILPSEDVDSKTLWNALEAGMPNLSRDEGAASSIQLGCSLVCGPWHTQGFQAIGVSGYDCC